MRCPRCSAADSAVVDTRGDNDGTSIRRRRECSECGYRFTTYERLERVLPMILKKDGRRQPFDRGKVRSGLMKACEKTSVTLDQIDQTVDVIESRVQELCAKEVPSQKIGDFLMEELKKLDKVAYVRFASVYREFTDINQFAHELQSLKAVEEPGKGKEARRPAPTTVEH